MSRKDGVVYGGVEFRRLRAVRGAAVRGLAFHAWRRRAVPSTELAAVSRDQSAASGDAQPGALPCLAIDGAIAAR